MPDQQLQGVQVLMNGVFTTTTQGPLSVDLGAKGLNLEKRNVKAMAFFHGVAGTTPSVTITIEESDTSAFTTTSAAASFTAVTTTASTNAKAHYKPTLRYQRATATYTANTTSAGLVVALIVDARDSEFVPS